MTPEEKVLDRNYRKNFGMSLAEVDTMFAAQGNCCAICKRPKLKNRLSVDHAHAFDRVKIRVKKEPGGGFWQVFADSDELNLHIVWTDEPDKDEARELMRLHLRRKSVRGGLCFLCNGGIQKFEDSKGACSMPPAERFEAAAAYLRKFNNQFTK